MMKMMEVGGWLGEVEGVCWGMIVEEEKGFEIGMTTRVRFERKWRKKSRIGGALQFAGPSQDANEGQDGFGNFDMFDEASQEVIQGEKTQILGYIWGAHTFGFVWIGQTHYVLDSRTPDLLILSIS